MKQLILCCLICLYCQSIKAQIVESIQQKYTTYDSINTQEKVYVQTDRTFYAPNEEIWWNVFVTNAKNAPSTLSEQVYAELYSPNGTKSDALILKNKGGYAQGYFKLKSDAVGGIYKLRVYTYWMQNFGEENYFEKELTVQKTVLPEVLMQLDFEREAYGAGDEVVAIFKAKTKDNKALAHKKLTYTVQLNGQLVTNQTATTDDNGKALLSYKLPDKLTETNNLINVQFEESGLTESITRSAPIVLNNLDIQLLPEGGTVVANQKNRIAIKVLNEFGQPADIKGEIVNKSGNVIQEFSTFHQGMGAFELVPEKNENYMLRVTQPVGIRQTWKVPSVETDRLGIFVKKQQDQRIEFDLYSPKEQRVFVVAQQQGNLIYTQEIKAVKGANTVAFSTEDFPMGIVQLTVVDEKERVHAERLVFVNAQRKLKVHISTNKEDYLPREKVVVDIWAKDETGRGVQGNFSMAVVDDKQHTFADDKQDNILSYLLMSSELKGEIYEPNFYFDPKNEKAAAALDYVLLTHGWRRFEWQTILEESNRMTIRYPILANEISGYVKIGDQLGKKQTIFLSEGQARYTKKKALATTQTDDNGFFTFKNVTVSFPAFLSTTYHGEYQSIRINQYSKPGLSWERTVPGIYHDQIVNQGYYKKKEDGKLYDRYNQQVDVVNSDIVSEDGRLVTTSKNFKIVDGLIKTKHNYTVRIDEEGYVFSNEGRLSKAPVNVNSKIVQKTVGNKRSSPIVMDSISYTVPQNRSLDWDRRRNADKYTERIELSTSGLTSERALASVMLSTESVVVEASNIEIMNSGRNNRYNVTPSFQEELISPSVYLIQVAPKNLQYKSIPRFYQPNYSDKRGTPERTDFRKTIYWNPSIQTNKNGKASLSYYNSDEVTTFRILLEGNNAEGQLAHEEHTYSTSLPFNIVTKIPSVLSFGDTVRMPIVLQNNSSKTVAGALKIEVPSFLNVLEMPSKNISIAADTQQVVHLLYQVRFEQGKAPIYISFESDGLNDFITQTVETTAKGFPVDFVMAGQELEQVDTFVLRDVYEGSLTSTLKFYPDILEGLMDGVESILNSPSGCFEQVSSSNYPNILALQLMQQTGVLKVGVRQKALEYLHTGYHKLAAYEINGGGFEWYGRAPAHEGLTAYGLVQFKDMQEVYEVEAGIIERTKNYLLSRRNGKGGFEQNVGKYGFSGNKPALFNAYITWALSEVNTKGIHKEVEAMTREAIASEDLYRMSLAALTHFNIGNQERAENLLKNIQNMILKLGLENVFAESTVTYSYGKALNIETLSFAALAMLRSEHRNEALIVKIVEYLLSKRQYGRFGSTQSTVMALKALSAYTSSVLKQQEDKSIQVEINGKVVWKDLYRKHQKGNLLVTDLHQYFVEGQNIVAVKFDAATQGLPYSFDVSWTSQTPESAAECPLMITSTFDKKEAKVGETVRLDVTVQNSNNEAVPSTMAWIGIPAGLSVQAWQLKDLQEKQQFAFYELKDNYLILYYRELDGQETKTLSLDLKTEVPGHYTAPANTTYLYYGDEYKYWLEGASIQVN